MTRLVSLAVLAGAITFTACDSFGQAMSSHTDVVARAADQELTVEQVTALLVPVERIPASNEVVSAVANLWVDYTLLATAVAEDSTLQNVNLDGIVVPYFNQMLVYELRDRVIQADTVIDDAELRQIFDAEQPSAEVRARHILFRMPADASPAVRDSVQARARQVLEQARGGADFAQLASQYSEEPRASETGGDLGFFGPGQMVQPFEEAAFKLQAGEISPNLVETPFGYHIIKVEEKRVPDFDAVKEDFRQSLIRRRVAEAEEGFLTSLTSSRNIEVQEGAVGIARDLAGKPNTQLSRRAAGRMLVEYTNGGITAGEYLDLMRQRNPQQRAQIAAASDEQLNEWLSMLARDELLIERAEQEGLTTPPARLDSARAELRAELRQAARDAGLLPIIPAQGESREQAVQRVVMDYIRSVISGERNVLPLDAIAFSLRQKYDAEVMERAIPAVVAQVQEARPPAPQQVPGGMPPGGVPQGAATPQGAPGQQPPPMEQPVPPTGGN